MSQEKTIRKSPISDRLRPLMMLGSIYLGISLLLRMVLWWQFGMHEDVTLLNLFWVLGLGIWRDVLVLPFVLGPLAALLFLIPASWMSRRWLSIPVGGVTYLLLFGMMYLPFVEYFFFQEFDARFNLVAVDYLIYPHEVLINIWESYPVVWVLLATGILAMLALRFLWPALRRGLQSPCALRLRSIFAVTWLLVALAAVWLPDYAPRYTNRVADELSANGLQTLMQAFCTNELSYVKYYRTIREPQAFDLMRHELGGTGIRSNVHNLNRTVAARPDGLGAMNVVVIVEESFGAGFIDSYGHKRGLTPAFDRLAAKGLRFSNAFATGTRTVRGLEAITLSLPPIPSESVVKRPGCEGLANWGQIMRSHGYHSSFLYGGYGYFDNMNHFFGSNGFALSDRTDIVNPRFTNIWGVSDEDLLQHALDYYDKEQQSGKPFFSIVMSTSNHRPYTFPQGVPGVPAEGGGRKAGVRYADYALGRFMDAARQHSWFGNTLFVIVADHDARVYGRAQVPVEHYRIPLLFYAPGKLPPRVCDTAISQMDIAPTVLGLLGLGYTAPFYGQDILHLAPGADHPILLNHNHDVALLDKGQMVVLGLNRKVDSYDYDAQQKSLTPAAPQSGLVDLATAYYQTAFDLFEHHDYTLRGQHI